MKDITWKTPLDLAALFKEMPDMTLTGWDLATDVSEKDTAVVVEMQLPGIEPDSYDITLEGNRLMVVGDREDSTETQDANVVRKEIQRGHSNER